jgi:sulfate adenylyltransferase subunit 2
MTAALSPARLTHLQRLEAESIHIMREVVSEAERPVMLYSIGKDSAVMLHLAAKAFYPSKPPFPLLHVDTTWKFQAMYEMRERMAKELGFDLLVYKNPEAEAQGINPFDHGPAHTDLWKTEGLKQALDKYGFDAAFGGARRDEEKSRAKERIFSFRSAEQRWDPKNQRPELWRLYNARKNKGESIRVFPISNWTELDIWQYIHLENIPIVPLYFSGVRPVVDRDGTLIMVDDDRFRLRDGRGSDDEVGPLPHPRLLPADRRGGEHGRDPARDHPGDAAHHHQRASGAGHRPRPGRLDGEEEAGGVLLMGLPPSDCSRAGGNPSGVTASAYMAWVPAFAGMLGLWGGSQ